MAMTGGTVDRAAMKSRWQLLGLGVLLLMGLLAAYGAWIDFLPSSAASAVGQFASLVIGIVAASWIWWRRASGRMYFRGGPVKMAVAALFLAWFIAMLCWFTLFPGVMGAITRTAGGEWSEVVTLSPGYSRARYYNRCPYRLVGHLDGGYGAYYLCSNEAYYRAHARHRVQIELQGRRTSLGFYISQYRHVAEADERAGSGP